MKTLFSQLKAPAMVFLVGLAFTSGLVGVARYAAQNRERARFERLVDTGSQAIAEQSNFYALMVRGLAGLFSSGMDVRPANFRNYVERLRLRERYPGVDALAWLAIVEPEHEEEFLKWARSEVDPDYRIWPESAERSIPVVFIEPASARRKDLIGFNPMTDPSRREAIEESVRTGFARITEPIRLIQDFELLGQGPDRRVKETATNGFALFAPVFRGGRIPESARERQAQVVGFCSGGFRSVDFLEEIFGGEATMVQVDLFDGADPGPLIPMASFEVNQPDHSPRFTETRQAQVWGRVWTLRFSSRPEFEMSADPSWTLLLGVTGLFASLVLAEMTRRRVRLAGELATSRADLVRLNRNLEKLVEVRTRVAEERAARLRELNEELVNAEQRERARIAQILHDDLQQILVAAKMRFSALAGQVEPERLDPGLDLIAKAIQTGRSLSTQLEPGVLKERGLVGALEWAARKAGESHNLQVKVELDPAAEPKSKALKLFLLRATQEALLNVVKHAGTLEADVRLAKHSADRLELTITDHGRGCEEQALRSLTVERFGLFSIKSRLELFGGEFECISADGHGCKIRLVAPLE